MTGNNFKKGKRVTFLLYTRNPPKLMRGEIVGFKKRGKTALVKVRNFSDLFAIPRRLLMNPQENRK